MCFVVLLLSTKIVPTIKAIIAIAATTINGARQLNVSIKKPVKVGPIAGADCATIPVRPMAKPRFSGGKSVKTVNCMSGNKIPAPTACMIRAIMSKVKLGESAATIEPTKKALMAKI